MLHSLLSSFSWFGLENNERALVIKERMEGLFHLNHPCQSVPSGLSSENLASFKMHKLSGCQYCYFNSKKWLNLSLTISTLLQQQKSVCLMCFWCWKNLQWGWLKRATVNGIRFKLDRPKPLRGGFNNFQQYSNSSWVFILHSAMYDDCAKILHVMMSVRSWDFFTTVLKFQFWVKDQIIAKARNQLSIVTLLWLHVCSMHIMCHEMCLPSTHKKYCLVQCFERDLPVIQKARCYWRRALTDL